MSADPADLQSYTYTSLAPGEIRLLVPDTLHANNGLSWTLQTVKLDDELDFDALSYTWGSQDDTFPVSCNARCFRVHHNLYTALPYLARRENHEQVTTQPIWADAICINQADDEEKAVQIDLMGDIYKRARTVWVWLGVANHAHVEHILSRLPIITEFGEDLARRKGFVLNTIPRPWELHQCTSEHLHALKCLLHNPWFLRLWVVQEVALARHVLFLCGQHKIDFNLLTEARCYDSCFQSVWQDVHGKRLVKEVTDDNWEVGTGVKPCFS